MFREQVVCKFDEDFWEEFDRVSLESCDPIERKVLLEEHTRRKALKAKEAAQLSEEQLAECGRKAEKWDPRSPVLAEVFGDAYRLKLIELYFSPSPVSQAGRVVRREKENRLAEAAVHWYREQEKRSPKDDVPAVRRASILDLQGKSGRYWRNARTFFGFCDQSFPKRFTGLSNHKTH
jgi:hypothetical protein